MEIAYAQVHSVAAAIVIFVGREAAVRFLPYEGALGALSIAPAADAPALVEGVVSVAGVDAAG